MSGTNRFVIKTLDELEPFIWRLVDYTEYLISKQIEAAINVDFEIDIFSLQKNIFNEIKENGDLPKKLVDFKIKQLEGLSKATFECAEFYRDLSRTEDLDTTLEMENNGYNLLGAHCVLLDYIKLLTDKDKEAEIPKQKVMETYPEVFIESGYELFYYLNENYSTDNKVLRTKYSNLYHFLKYENVILATQIKYMGFIETEYKVEMSKILPKSFKYSEKIQPFLSRLKNEFKQQRSNGTIK